MKTVYKNCILAKGSLALDLYQTWQNTRHDRPKAQKALDDHMRQLEKTYQELHYGKPC